MVGLNATLPYTKCSSCFAYLGKFTYQILGGMCVSCQILDKSNSIFFVGVGEGEGGGEGKTCFDLLHGKLPSYTNYNFWVSILSA